MSREQLFAGESQVFGGLSNESELSRLCPKEFNRNNPWSNYAKKFLYHGGGANNWKWKSGDTATRVHQYECFKGLLTSFSLPHQVKLAVAGWMLSEMLSEVPEHIPHEETKKT